MCFSERAWKNDLAKLLKLIEIEKRRYAYFRPYKHVTSLLQACDKSAASCFVQVNFRLYCIMDIESNYPITKNTEAKSGWLQLYSTNTYLETKIGWRRFSKHNIIHHIRRLQEYIRPNWLSNDVCNPIGHNCITAKILSALRIS